MSAETRRKISESLKGRALPPEHREKLRLAHLDVPLSAEHRAAISRAGKGRTPWNKGRRST